MQNYSRPKGDFPDNRDRSVQVDTNAEIFYYRKQINSRTLMVVVLTDGEEIEGTIEWHDREALKINRTDDPNLLVLKHNIKYMYKAEDRKPPVKAKK
ncbi:MAG: hypothetical protein IPN69_15780 [Acidobacteria bacterium]|nr:hypothetical protein [Acidobacteriota bacterium]MBK8147883.1 hypothetical protein [Acidobacteriota bacterium]MBK8812170.1 hypothetical protein [Acidobacteriota bacterium]